MNGFPAGVRSSCANTPTGAAVVFLGAQSSAGIGRALVIFDCPDKVTVCRGSGAARTSDAGCGAMRDPCRRTLILKDCGIAVVVFLELRPGLSKHWGCYTALRGKITTAQSRTAWVTCQAAAIGYAFGPLRIEMLYCETLRTHKPMVRLSDRVGFETIGEKPPFVVKQLTRAAYQESRFRLRLLVRLGELEIRADPRDFKN